MSQSIPTGYIPPPGNPRGLAQKTCPGGRDLTFESCPGGENSTRTGILWKMEMKLQKNSVDQIFTGENKNKLNFLPFSRFTCFVNGIFPGLWVNYLVLLSHIPYKQSEELPWLAYIWSFPWVMVIHTYFCTKGCDYVKRFVHVLVLCDKYRVSQKFAKNGEHCIGDFQFKLC